MKRLVSTAALLLIATSASANLNIEFREGAPKDRFVVSNVGDCDLNDVAVTIDFKNSSGKLIFDITGSGPGVEVFQPLKIESGAKYLTKTPVVIDGQTAVTFDISDFSAGKKLVVSTDVDDTIGAREITVRSSEFSGTEVRVSVNGKTARTIFGDKPSAVVELENC